MQIENNSVEQPTIPHGDAVGLFPVEELNVSTIRNRDAVLALETVEKGDVLVVSPNGMASGYYLGGHPLTLLPVEALPAERRRELSDALDGSVQDFEYVCVGRRVESGPNHSLSEFDSSA
jgi:hypothetical protein